MTFNRKPIAFVCEDGFLIPNPVFNESSLKYLRGRYIYTQAELDKALREQDELQNSRRELADNHLGSDARTVDLKRGSDYTITEIADAHIGERQTVPSFDAPPDRKSQKGGKSQKLTQPNQAVLTPEQQAALQTGSVYVPPQTDEEGGLSAQETLQAIFGNKADNGEQPKK